MAGHNYLSNPKNPFFSLEDDVDDETFLSNAPARNYPAGHYQNFDNDVMQKRRQELLQRKKEIEERTIQSSERSVSLLRDSEQIGVATAEVLHS
jgi:synaptosomal-associated protein 29